MRWIYRLAEWGRGLGGRLAASRVENREVLDDRRGGSNFTKGVLQSLGPMLRSLVASVHYAPVVSAGMRDTERISTLGHHVILVLDVPFGSARRASPQIIIELTRLYRGRQGLWGNRRFRVCVFRSWFESDDDDQLRLFDDPSVNQGACTDWLFNDEKSMRARLAILVGTTLYGFVIEQSLVKDSNSGSQTLDGAELRRVMERCFLEGLRPPDWTKVPEHIPLDGPVQLSSLFNTRCRCTVN